ncbi:MAG: phosphotransferase, partial [Mesorhizobium sp.]|nr:phosphotransferase [Mesorhizobium sp.]
LLPLAAEIAMGEDVHFKGPVSIAEIQRLNCGLFYGYSQIGKILTFYPREENVARLAKELARVTYGMCGPAIPFERRVAEGSPVFARYGVFVADDSATLLVPGSGTVEPDRRDRNPVWAPAPDGLFEPIPERTPGPLSRTFRAYRCVIQRGKGGVYRAIDLSSATPRHCLLKEGRRLGELEFDGNDGFSRVKREHEALLDLRRTGVPVPMVYGSFEEGGNMYLALEWIDGNTLLDRLNPAGPKLHFDEALNLAIQAARLLENIHAGGWVWRDLKAANFLLGPGEKLVAVDFEGAERIGREITSPWGTPGHFSVACEQSTHANVQQDCFALGALIHHLFTSEIPQPPELPLLRATRADAPEVVEHLIADLTDKDPTRRPSAETAACILRKVNICA